MKLDLASTRFGILFSLLATLFGIGLGIAFGAAEDSLKNGLKEDANAVLETVYKGDQAKADKTWKKAWVYYKRAHLHAGGMGATALGICLLLSVLAISAKVKMVASTMTGLGALGYPIYWLMAGCSAPSMGSTGAAKESLDWLAIPTSGLYMFGILITAFYFVQQMFLKKTEEAKE